MTQAASSPVREPTFESAFRVNADKLRVNLNAGKFKHLFVGLIFGLAVLTITSPVRAGGSSVGISVLDVGDYSVNKTINYDQSDPSTVTLDPNEPYIFASYVNAGEVGTILSSSTLMPPTGSTVNYDAGSNGLNYQENFPTKTALDAALPPNGPINLTIQTSTPSTYTTQFTFGSDDYPSTVPQLTSITNATWSNGYLVITDPTQPVTLTWNTPGGVYSGININGTSGDLYNNPPFLNQTSATLPANLFANNAYYQANIVFSNSGGTNPNPIPVTGTNGSANFQTQVNFTIQVGTPVTKPVNYVIQKDHVLVQTSNSAPADGSGDNNDFDAAPYNVSIESPVTGSVTGPGGKTYPLNYNSSGGNGDSSEYDYSSGPIATLGGLNASYRDGNYTLNNSASTNGNVVTLIGGLFPNVPQVTLVNGATPVWNTQGQLVLDPTVNNTITWTAFNASATTFSASGHEDVHFQSDSGDNVNIKQSSGITEVSTLPFTTLTIPANSMTTEHSYVGNLAYAHVSSATSLGGGVYEVAVYQTETYFTVVAVTPPTLLYAATKENILQQTSNSVPVNAPGSVALAPYNFNAQSPVAGSVTGPSGAGPYALAPDSSEQKYKYDSVAYPAQGNLDASFADGAYTLADGSQLSLTGDAYPNVPEVTLVNGSTPTWNAQGQLVLDPTIDNTVTWLAFSTSNATYTPSTGGYEKFKLQGNQDSISLSQDALTPAGDSIFNTYFIPAGTLTAGNTYSSKIEYVLASGLANPSTHVFDAVGYGTEMVFTAVAVPASSGSTTQTITFPSPGNEQANGATITLNATSDSGLTVTLSVVSGPATLNSNNLTFTGTGTVVVEASQPGDGTYATATPVFQTLTVTPANDVGNYTLQKSINYDQSSASAPTLDPQSPYQFSSNINSGPSVATILSSSTLTPPTGGTGTVLYQSISLATSNSLQFSTQFITKAAMDAAFPNGTATNPYNFTIQTNTPGTYNEQLAFGADNYPVVPQITSVTNATWSGNHLVITDPAQPVTLTCNYPNGAAGGFFINTVQYFQSFSAGVNSTTFTIPTGIGLQNNTNYGASISFSNVTGGVTFQTQVSFNIQVGTPTSSSSTNNTIQKSHILVQTSNSAPVNGSGNNQSFKAAPYNLKIESSVAGTVTGPNSTSLPLGFDSEANSSGGYRYSSGAVTSQANLDSMYPNGAYTLTDGHVVNLTGNIYPNAPQVTLVNGATPAWNAQGQLVLNPAVTNTITWTAFNVTNAVFASTGHEDVNFTDANGNDIVPELQSGVTQASTTPFTTLTIPANTMTAGNTYVGDLSYLLVSTLTSPGVNAYDVAGYQTETLFTVAASSSGGLFQTINFPAINAVQFAGSTIALSATASSGLPISYSIEGVIASISNNLITFTQTGFAEIDANQAGNSTYAAASVAAQNIDITTPTDLSFYSIEKSVNYAQTSATTVTLEPEDTYEFDANVQPGTTGSLLSSSTLTPPTGSTGTVAFQSSSNGLNFFQNFTTKAAMDAAFKSGATTPPYNFTIQTSTPSTYNNALITLGADNYPTVIPQLTSFTNAVWSGNHLVVLDPTQPVTFNWNSFNSANGYISFNIDNLNVGQSFSANATSFTLPANTFANNTAYQGELNFSNSGTGSSSIPGIVGGPDFALRVTFTIEVGTPLASSATRYGVAKIHVQVQTSNNAPVDGSGEKNGYDAAPYNFHSESPVSGTAIGPGNKSYTLLYDPYGGDNNDNLGDYKYSSGAITTQATLDSTYANGNYTLADGHVAALTGSVYPNVPQVTLVNGVAPVWNALGQLVLDPTVANTLTWTAFNVSNATFASNGHEDVEFSSNNGGNLDIEQQTGVSESSSTSFTTLTIPANTMTATSTYVGSVDYFLASSVNSPSANVYDYAGYQSETYFTAVAQIPPAYIAGFTTATSQPPFIATGFNVTGNTLDLNLGFALAPGTVLTVLNNTGSGPIVGNFNNLPDGGTITAYYNGSTYTFTANYEGGDGNDLTLTYTPVLSHSSLAILHSFLDGSVANDGSLPVAALTQGSDGSFYGTTQIGGSAGYGTVFKINAQGVVNILHSFGDGSVTNDGNNPEVALIQGTDGNFYGTTDEGGSAGLGAAFKITPQGVLTILHNFGDNSVANDGYNPEAALIQSSDGNFYGTTQTGGSAGYGTVFKMTPTGTVTILHSFQSGNPSVDGSYPEAGLIQGSDGNYYGTTEGGGNIGLGAVFKMTPAGTVTILHSFGDGSVTNDGNNPEAGLIQGPDGNFYGTTSDGGFQNNGNVFKITPAGTVTILHSFGDGSVTNDGSNPEAGLIKGSDGNFYGTTEEGGSSGSGTAFKISPQGVVKILHSFGDGSVANDGSYSLGALIQGSDGNLYGTTSEGGLAGDGTIFKLAEGVPVVTSALTVNGTVSLPFQYQTMATNTPTSYAATNLPAGLSINTTTGLITGTPTIAGTTTVTLTLSNGAGSNSVPLTITVIPLPEPVVTSILYAYGVANAASNYQIYQITATNNPTSYSATGLPTGLSINTATGAIAGNPTVTGTFPVSLTATNGLGAGNPVILSLIISATTPTLNQEYNILHDFNDGSVTNDAQNPSVIFQGFDGTFYGLSASGGAGAAGMGAIFNTTVQGITSVFDSFGAGSGSAGAAIPKGLIQAADGSFYGTTSSGGSSALGTVFKITPQGTVTVLHSFGDGSVVNDGAVPQAGLIQGADGNFYGTTYAGGSATFGTVFKITPQGTVTILHSFGDGSVTNDGSIPYAGLIQGIDGNFYGTTKFGGSQTSGVIFQMTPAGTVTILHSFLGSGSNDGANPVAPLIQGFDTNFYGTTSSGGTASDGTVFEMILGGTVNNPTGTVTVLHSFLGNSSNDGAAPVAPLIQGFDTNFYGTTSNGGSANDGTVFEVSSDGSGTTTIIHQFGDGTVPNDGINPNAGLYQGLDGNFYGTTSMGGSAGNGTVFVIVASQAPTHKPIITGATTFVSSLLNPLTYTPKATFGLASGGVGTSFIKAALGASKGITKSFTTATYWTLTGTLPQLLTFDATSGTITGTPTQAGTYTVTLTTVNAVGTSAPETVTFYVDVPPVLNCPTTANGSANTLFTYQITAAGNPTSFGATGLPGWLSVDTTTGIISGTPPGPGIYTFSPTASNVAGQVTQQVLLAVTGSSNSPIINSPATATGTAGTPFTYQITTAQGDSTSFSALTLPTGLLFDPTSGMITGTPTTAGTFIVPIGATNASGSSAAILTLTIVPLTEPDITSALSVLTAPNTAFSYQITAAGIVSNYGASGLPAGLSINPLTGLITGIPSFTGTFFAAIAAGNGAGDNMATLQLTVANTNATVTLGNLSATYNGTAKTATATTSPAGLNVTFTYNGSATPPTAAGSYTVVGTINDTFYQGSGTGTLVISPVPITVALKAGTSVYGQNISTLTPGISVTGLVTGDTVSSLGYTSVITGTGAGITTTTDAGSYKLTIGGALTNTNYVLKTGTTFSGGATTWTVSQDTLTVNGLSGTSVYGQTPTAPSQPYTIVSSNGVTNQTTLLALLNSVPTTTAYTFNITNASNAGKYATDKVTAALLTASVSTKDYKVAVGAAGAWTVTQDIITIAGLTNGSSTYGSTPVFNGASYFTVTDTDNTTNVSNLVANVKATLSVTTTTNAGTVSVPVAGVLATGISSTNYKVALVPGSWKVNPQPVAITIGGGSSVYGVAPKVPTLTATAVVGGKNTPLTSALLKGLSTNLLTVVGKTGNTGVGAYTINLTGTPSGNYTYTGAESATTATWNITPATISAITVNKSATSTYGSYPIDKALTVTGLVNGDLPHALGYTLTNTSTSGSLTATANVGAYTFTVGGSLTDGNYVLKTGVANPPATPTGSKVTVTPAATLTITLLNGNSTLGTAPTPENFSYSVTGFLNGDTTDSTDILIGFTVTPAITATTNAGSYKLTPVAPAVLSDPNYKVLKLVGGTWTVQP